MTKPTLLRSLFGVSFAAAVLLGCPAPDETSADVCTDIYKAFRGYFERCGGRISTKRLDAWQKDFGRVCKLQVDAPGASGVASGLRACAAKLPDAPCGDFPECDLPPGELEAGAACGDDGQCKSSECQIASDEQGEPTSQCGRCAQLAAIGGDCSEDVVCPKGAACVEAGDERTCVAITKRKEGESCDSRGQECEEGLACEGRLGDTKCVPPGDVGAACSSLDSCKNGLVCANATCANAAKEGEACSLGTCGPQLGCDLTTRKCAKIAFVADGAECDNLTRVCETGSCEGVSFASSRGEVTITPGKCVAPIPEGGACGPAVQGSCADFARCIAGKCVIPDPSTCR
jgi:hypothetical protein